MAGVALFGVTGRMGQALVRLLLTDGGNAGLRLSGAIASSSSTHLGHDAMLAGLGPESGVPIIADASQALLGAAVAVDFSRADSVAAHVRLCGAMRIPLLVGTTGFDHAAQAEVEQAALSTPVLVAANTSSGVAVMGALVRQAAQALAGYDVEISETHHRLKRDAPSGTALALGGIVAAARGVALDEVAVFDRHGQFAPRRDGDIGFAVRRAGDVVGEHTVTFAIAGELLEITHRATDRNTFARGALRAAQWLSHQPPGLYGMQDALRPEQP